MVSHETREFIERFLRGDFSEVEFNAHIRRTRNPDLVVFAQRITFYRLYRNVRGVDNIEYPQTLTALYRRAMQTLNLYAVDLYGNNAHVNNFLYIEEAEREIARFIQEFIDTHTNINEGGLGETIAMLFLSPNTVQEEMARIDTVHPLYRFFIYTFMLHGAPGFLTEEEILINVYVEQFFANNQVDTVDYTPAQNATHNVGAVGQLFLEETYLTGYTAMARIGDEIGSLDR